MHFAGTMNAAERRTDTNSGSKPLTLAVFWGPFVDVTLKDKFFETVYEHFKAKACSLRRFVETTYSFEEWINWESFLACAEAGFAKVVPKPCYSQCGAGGCQSSGDILLENGHEKVLVEIGLAHDGTGSKWLTKLEDDRKKLSQPLSAGIVPIHLVTCMSRRNVCTDPRWTEWLKRLNFWSQPTCFDRLLNLEPGTAHFRAWIVPRTP